MEGGEWCTNCVMMMIMKMTRLQPTIANRISQQFGGGMSTWGAILNKCPTITSNNSWLPPASAGNQHRHQPTSPNATLPVAQIRYRYRYPKLSINFPFFPFHACLSCFSITQAETRTGCVLGLSGGGGACRGGLSVCCGAVGRWGLCGAGSASERTNITYKV